jgi:cardiolipin synthase
MSRNPLAALAACWIAASAGCVSLPDARRDRAAAHSSQVDFDGAGGTLPAALSDTVLAGLEGAEGASSVLRKHLAYEQSVNAGSPLVLGNRLTLLQDGPATYAAMFAAIRGARDHINLETYIFEDDEAGRKFSELLLERQAAGIQVNVIYDSVGALMTPAAFFDRLAAAGIRVLQFNPVNPLAGGRRSWLLNNRDHRRQLIVDGRIAFTGGVNISDTYSSAPGKRARKQHAGDDPEVGWRDTHVRIEGPVVAEFQRLFLDTWARQKGEPLAPRAYFPSLAARGGEIVRAIGSTPDDPHSLIYLTLLSAITHAERRVELTVAYFAPDPQLLNVLTDAARRGVEVTLLLPSRTDSWAIFHLGRSHYAELLKGGVKIYERRGALMHAKTASIDGVWSSIGSTNLDWRSFLHNDEINAVVLGRAFATQMEAMFAADLAQSQAITLERWRQRGALNRMKEWAARLGAYWL